jgi:hypothetical protein
MPYARLLTADCALSPRSQNRLPGPTRDTTPLPRLKPLGRRPPRRLFNDSTRLSLAISKAGKDPSSQRRIGSSQLTGPSAICLLIRDLIKTEGRVSRIMPRAAEVGKQPSFTSAPTTPRDPRYASS